MKVQIIDETQSSIAPVESVSRYKYTAYLTPGSNAAVLKFKRDTHGNEYWGYVYLSVLCNQHDGLQTSDLKWMAETQEQSTALALRAGRKVFAFHQTEEFMEWLRENT